MEEIQVKISIRRLKNELASGVNVLLAIFFLKGGIKCQQHIEKYLQKKLKKNF